MAAGMGCRLLLSTGEQGAVHQATPGHDSKGCSTPHKLPVLRWSAACVQQAAHLKDCGPAKHPAGLISSSSSSTGSNSGSRGDTDSDTGVLEVCCRPSPLTAYPVLDGVMGCGEVHCSPFQPLPAAAAEDAAMHHDSVKEASPCTSHQRRQVRLP